MAKGMKRFGYVILIRSSIRQPWRTVRWVFPDEGRGKNHAIENAQHWATTHHVKVMRLAEPIVSYKKHSWGSDFDG